jgi:pimeloyl-ACP methyl ester carboxylesterase
MRSYSLYLALLTVAAAGAQTALPPRPNGPIWGSLAPGPYAVGFRSLYQLDTARSYDPDYPVDGKPGEKKPRPIFIAVWYPADARTSKPMEYRDYLRAVSSDSPVPEFTQRLRKFTRDMVCEYMLRKEFKSLTKEERAVWDKFLTSPTLAYRDAPSAAGKFPVVIDHPGLGGTFEDNSVLFEYLASHGYVVVSSAYEMADSTRLNIDGNFFTSLDDLSFLSRFAGTLPFADTSRLAAMGHSYGAQAVLAWRAQPNSPLDAVVFIDSTVEYRGLKPDFAEFEAMLNRNRKSSVPVVFFADRRREPKFETFDPYLPFAPRYESTVDDQEHNDFVSQGAIGESLLAGISGAPAKAAGTWRNLDRIGLQILQFLDAYLKRDAAALALLKGSGLHYKPPEPMEPTGRQLARMLQRDGPDKLRKLLVGLKTIDPEVFGVAAWVLSNDGRKQDAVTILMLATEFVPGSADLQQSLGEALEEVGDAAKAAAAYRRALQLLDSDSTLKDDEKASMRKELEDRLRVLAR